MATEEERNRSAIGLRNMSQIGARAAVALDLCVPGPNRDKRVARLFRCSVRLAQYLRKGQCWTAARLSQASGVLGADFDIALAGIDIGAEIAQLRARLNELEGRIRGNGGEGNSEGHRTALDPGRNSASGAG